MPLKVKMKVDAPKIELDEENCIFLIEGHSYPADAFEIYEPVIDWVQKYGVLLDRPLICEFKFRMLSSASRKMIFKIFNALEELSSKGKNISIHWFYEKYDEDMMKAGEDYADIFKLPFHFFHI